jgi:hypothetical protein
MANPAAVPLIFANHNHQDAAFCRAYVFALRGYGYEVWYDEHNLGPGGELRRVIESQLQTREYFAVDSNTDGWAVGPQGTIIHVQGDHWTLYNLAGIP